MKRFGKIRAVAAGAKRGRRIGALAAAALGFTVVSAHADEGMWTFDHFPAARVKAKYGFAPDQSWLDRVQAAALRLPGCSGSFVSGEGLVLTNWHCVQGCVEQLASPDNDLVAKGFRAVARTEERKCPGFQVQGLLSITDVSDRIRAATANAAPDQFARLRDQAAQAISEEACKGHADLDCNIVSLYRGGQFKLYTYRNYKDVRLVFVPEYATGFFGGDPDNFNFPRYSLDSAFLRVYDGDKPLATPNHLKWRNTPPSVGELTFVAGNPGSTQRQTTIDQLVLQRDVTNPFLITLLSERRGRLDEYGATNAEARRQANEVLFGLENGFKVIQGQEAALRDPAFLGTLEKSEADLRAELAKRPDLAAAIGDPWAEIAAADSLSRNLFKESYFLTGPGVQNFAVARQLVRLAAERAKPEKDRLPGFSDAAIARAKEALLRSGPARPELDKIAVEFWALKMREYLSPDHALVKLALGREAPDALAKRVVDGTKLGDPKVREALFDGGQAAIAASEDPMIKLAAALEPRAREMADLQRAKIAGPVGRAAEKIARARFAVYGDSLYPDATFTLRLSYGVVEGWSYEGRVIEPFTKFGGLYDRATGSFPFALAPSWVAAQAKLDPSTPFDVSTSNDIIGGNSGSPLLDRDGQVIGAVFDGNIHSTAGSFGYDPRLNRAVSVLAGAITQALRKVYDLPALADELDGGAGKSGVNPKKGQAGRDKK